MKNPFRIFRKSTPEPEQRSAMPNWMARLFGDFFQSHSGIHVTSKNAWKYTAYYAGVDLISNAFIRMPILFYQNQPDGGRKRIIDHPVARLLHDRPNPEQTPACFKKYLVQCALTEGNGYAEIQRDGNGKPIALWPIPPQQVRPARDESGQLVYFFRKDEQSAEIPMFYMDVLHLHGLGDGLVGYSQVQLFAEAIGLGLSAERAGASLYKNGIRPTGILEYPGKFQNDEALERLRKQFQDRYGGQDNTGRPIIAEGGLKWVPIAMSLSDAQFIETRVRQIREIAMILHLPAHKLGDLERSSFSNIEEQNIDVVGDCYDPWGVLLREELNAKLLKPSEQGKYFCEFQMDALLRANKESRTRAIQTEVYTGTLTRNEARRMENRPALPGLDDPIMPVNYVAIGKDGKPVSMQQAPESPTPDQKNSIDLAHRGLLLDVCSRIVRMQAGALLKARKKADAPSEALASVFDAEHVAKVVALLDAPVRACAHSLNLHPNGFLPRFSQEYTEKCRSARVSPACEPPFSAESLTDMLIEELTKAAVSAEGEQDGNV